jgi:hypothetical protein
LCVTFHALFFLLFIAESLKDGFSNFRTKLN